MTMYIEEDGKVIAKVRRAPRLHKGWLRHRFRLMAKPDSDLAIRILEKSCLVTSAHSDAHLRLYCDWPRFDESLVEQAWLLEYRDG